MTKYEVRTFKTPDYSNKVEMLARLKNYGRSLKYASDELKSDKEVVLVAVRQYGDALEYASKELQGDKEVVLAGLVLHGTMKYASKYLKALISKTKKELNTCETVEALKYLIEKDNARAEAKKFGKLLSVKKTQWQVKTKRI